LATRLLPHPPNVTAVGAVAVFAGAVVRDRRLAVAAPLAAMLLSDLALGLHVLVPVVYGSMAVSVLVGRWLAASRTVGGTAGATLLGAAQFFVVTNFACWLLCYPRTPDGLAACYVAALPFFRNSLLGDLGYTAAVFGLLWLAERATPAVRARQPLVLS
jgi:hypothetical protein